jgi:hypothetical protein
MFEPYMNDPVFRRRRVAGVAWALTCDSARLTGRPAAAGATVGELLLWFAESPADRRRRPIVSAHLVDLITAVVGGTPIPEPYFAPAARFRTVSPCARILRVLRTLGSGALATGVLVAIFAAVLRIWF